MRRPACALESSRPHAAFPQSLYVLLYAATLRSSLLIASNAASVTTPAADK